MNFKFYVKGFLVHTMILCIGLGIGLYEGKKQSFEDFILEKCWLNKTTRDIECIQYLAD